MSLVDRFNSWMCDNESIIKEKEKIIDLCDLFLELRKATGSDRFEIEALSTHVRFSEIYIDGVVFRNEVSGEHRQLIRQDGRYDGDKKSILEIYEYLNDDINLEEFLISICLDSEVREELSNII